MTDHYGGHEARSEDEVAAAGRVASFTDGVFAIAITLLVLPLTEARLTDAGLAGELRALGPQLFAFALSFLIIGRFWLAHHRMFRHIARLDGRLLALNLLVLLGVAFLPFPTKVVGKGMAPPRWRRCSMRPAWLQPGWSSRRCGPTP